MRNERTDRRRPSDVRLEFRFKRCRPPLDAVEDPFFGIGNENGT
jgi:hypothetical protein